jgi:hypothetical protein
MSDHSPNHVYLSYDPQTESFVADVALRLKGDARLSFWFEPWHAVPGRPIQEQMEGALGQATSCAVFIGSDGIEGWQNEQMRAAIQAHVEDDPGYRVIPVLLPGVERPKTRDLPRFLRLYHPVQFSSPDDDQAFRALLAGILGIPPIEVEGFLDAQATVVKEKAPPPTDGFAKGHALLIGVAHYPHVQPQLPVVLDDVAALEVLLTDPARCGYRAAQVTRLVDEAATKDGMVAALGALAQRVGPEDTAIVYFSGHGMRNPAGGDAQQYVLPYDARMADLAGTAIRGDQMTALLREVKAGRLLVIFDSCHSGGAVDSKAPTDLAHGLSDDYYAGLAQGRGRVVMASSLPEEESLILRGAANSLFTTHLLAALRGAGPTLGDGYVRVFDLFRHVARHVPAQARQVYRQQTPIFKATAMDEDFAVALARD